MTQLGGHPRKHWYFWRSQGMLIYLIPIKTTLRLYVKKWVLEYDPQHRSYQKYSEIFLQANLCPYPQNTAQTQKTAVVKPSKSNFRAGDVDAQSPIMAAAWPSSKVAHKTHKRITRDAPMATMQGTTCDPKLRWTQAVAASSMHL